MLKFWRLLLGRVEGRLRRLSDPRRVGRRLRLRVMGLFFETKFFCSGGVFERTRRQGFTLFTPLIDMMGGGLMSFSVSTRLTLIIEAR